MFRKTAESFVLNIERLTLFFILCLISVNVSSTEIVRGSNGMVVSRSAIASSVGSEIMQAGGNAIDAAVATAFALAVTYPAAGNLGGGVSW